MLNTFDLSFIHCKTNRTTGFTVGSLKAKDLQSCFANLCRLTPERHHFTTHTLNMIDSVQNTQADKQKSTFLTKL